MRLQPTQDRLLLLPDNYQTKTDSGLVVIREEGSEKPGTAEVLSIGPDVEERRWYPPGGRVVYSRFAGSPVTVDEIEYRIVREQDIIAVEIPDE